MGSVLVEPRTVTLTLPRIRTLTILEAARALAVAGVSRREVERLQRVLLFGQDAEDPADLERAATVMYAWAWQLERREDPGATWEDAQTWRVVFDADAIDPEAELVTELSVAAANVTGLTPAETRGLTLGELDAYAQLTPRGS